MVQTNCAYQRTWGSAFINHRFLPTQSACFLFDSLNVNLLADTLVRWDQQNVIGCAERRKDHGTSEIDRRNRKEIRILTRPYKFLNNEFRDWRFTDWLQANL